MIADLKTGPGRPYYVLEVLCSENNNPVLFFVSFVEQGLSLMLPNLLHSLDNAIVDIFIFRKTLLPIFGNPMAISKARLNTRTERMASLYKKVSCKELERIKDTNRKQHQFFKIRNRIQHRISKYDRNEI